MITIKHDRAALQVLDASIPETIEEVANND